MEEVEKPPEHSEKFLKYIPIPIYIYIAAIVVITIVMIALRIIFYTNDLGYEYANLRDVDFKTLHDLMGHGLIDYYKYDTIEDFRGIYLYYWYFMFFPIFLLPVEIGVYVWDALRITASIYVGLNIKKVLNPARSSEEKFVDIIIFIIWCSIAYGTDMYLNNTNWLIQILLFQSYLELKKGNKWLSGIFFVLAMYKINVIMFLFMLIYIRELNFKETCKYYLLPFILVCLPYMIFPNYFAQLLYNWTYIEGELKHDMTWWLQLYLLLWQAFQTSQLLYVMMILLIFYQNLKIAKWRWIYRIILTAAVIIVNISFPLLLWIVYSN